MDLGLENKVALVTGSTGGIGFAIAQTLAQEGAHVYINGRSEQKVEEAIHKGKKLKGKLRPAVFNLESKSESDALIKAIPSLDILVHNLGVYEVLAFEEISDENWLRFFTINVLASVRLSRHYFPLMKKQNWGRIVFISSESAIQTPVEMIHYGTTKTAQLAVARGLAEMTIGTNITINSILPGPTYTEGVEEYVKEVAKSKNISVQQVQDEFFKTVRPTSLIQRFATPKEVATFVTFVCSTCASAINGATLRVDGGAVHSII